MIELEKGFYRNKTYFYRTKCPFVLTQSRGEEIVILELIYEYIPDVNKPFTFLEVGVCEAHTAAVLLNEFPKMIYSGVDPYTDYAWGIHIDKLKKIEIVADTRLKGIERATQIKKPSNEAVKEFADNSLDVVFVDGDHQYEKVREDLELWYPKTRNLFIAHDYKLIDGVTRGIDDFCKKHSLAFEHDPFSAVAWIVK